MTAVLDQNLYLVSRGIPHPRQIVAHVYEVEQPSKPIAVISFDPDDPRDPGERIRRSEFLPRIGETISLWKGQRHAPQWGFHKDQPTYRVETIEHRLWHNEDESDAYYGDLIIIHVTQVSGPEPEDT
jgi:hypothetical protein